MGDKLEKRETGALQGNCGIADRAKPLAFASSQMVGN